MSAHTMKRSYRAFDFLLAAIVIGLAVFGIIIIGSATHVTLGGDVPDFFDKQKFWVASGVVIMLLAAFIDYHFISKFYIFIYVFNILLLVAVLFIGSDDSSGAARWIRFGGSDTGSGGYGIQPSEFCKVFMIVFLAKYIDKYSETINKPLMLLLTLGLVLLPVQLIRMQPSLSAALVVGMLSLAVLFVGMLSYKYIAPLLILGVPIVIVLLIDLNLPEPVIISKILNEYQLGRVMLWLHPDESDPLFYQTLQSIRALGSGMFSGKGLNNNSVHLPLAYNDFIFAIIGEELGFVGCMAVLGCILFIALKCLWIAHNAVDTTGRLIATGTGAMLAFQTFVNVGVATGLLPNTGAPLPFISYGGSSMWVSMAAIGFCINVGMTKPKSLFED